MFNYKKMRDDDISHYLIIGIKFEWYECNNP